MARPHTFAALTLIAMAALPVVARADRHAEDVGVLELTLPSGVYTKRVSDPLIDFMVFDVFQDKEFILGIYLGNAPQIDMKKFVARQKIGECIAKVLAGGVGKRGLQEAVIELSGNSPPKFVHFYVGKVSETQMEVVEKLLQTVRLKAGYSCSTEQ